MKNKSEKSNHEQQIRNTWTTNQKTQIEKPWRSSTNPDLPNPGATMKVRGGNDDEAPGEATHSLDWTQASNPTIQTEPRQRPLLSKTSMAEPPWLFLWQSLPPSVVVRSQPLLSELPWPSLWVWVFFEFLIWSRERKKKEEQEHGLCKN